MARGEDLFADGGGDGVDRFVDYLAEPQLEGDGAEDVGVGGSEAPAGDEESDHAEGGGLGGGGEVGAGFEDDPFSE